MNVLIIAIEDMRFGPARLPKVLAAAGFRVAALCPAENPLAHTSYLEQHFALPQAKSAFRLAAAIHRAMLEWQPHLVVPGDEQVVALLHTLLHYLGGKHTLGWPATMIDTLQRSLGAAGQRSAMLLKNDTQHLAKQIGVRVPDGREVRSLNDARQLARRVGFPLVVKKSFGSGGTGVKICHTEAQLAAAYAEMAAGPARPVKAWLRRLLGRD